MDMPLTEGMRGSVGNTGVGARYKENNPRVMMNCACHKSSLSAADGAAGVPELAVFDHQVKSFYNFFGHSVDRRTMHSHVRQRIQETVRHLKKGIVTRCVCAPVPVRVTLRDAKTGIKDRYEPGM